MSLNQFEQRRSSRKWESLEQAKQGISGDPDNVERIARARLKAQEIFEKIRKGKV